MAFVCSLHVSTSLLAAFNHSTISPSMHPQNHNRLDPPLLVCVGHPVHLDHVYVIRWSKKMMKRQVENKDRWSTVVLLRVDWYWELGWDGIRWNAIWQNAVWTSSLFQSAFPYGGNDEEKDDENDDDNDKDEEKRNLVVLSCFFFHIHSTSTLAIWWWSL